MVKRIPTVEEYETYRGGHTPQLWAACNDDWHCLSCKRSKFEIMRWITRYADENGKCTPYKGWGGFLHTHHDHGSYKRFQDTVICDQCNSLDGRAKKILGIDEDFSFSPLEIAAFARSQPHGQHKLKIEIARMAYQRYNYVLKKGHIIGC